MLQRAMLRPVSVSLAVLVAVATLIAALFDLSSTVRAGAFSVTPVTVIATPAPANDHTFVLNAQTLVVIHEDGEDGESRVTIMDPDKPLVLHLSGAFSLTEGVDLSR